MILELCNIYNPFGTMNTRLKILGVAWISMNVFYPIFLHRFFNLNRPLVEKVFWGYLIIAGSMTIFFVGQMNHTRFLITSLITTSIGFYSLSCYISGIIKKQPYAVPFSFFGMITIIGEMHDGLVYISKIMGNDIIIAGYNFDSMVLQFFTPFSTLAL